MYFKIHTQTPLKIECYFFIRSTLVLSEEKRLEYNIINRSSLHIRKKSENFIVFFFMLLFVIKLNKSNKIIITLNHIYL